MKLELLSQPLAANSVYTIQVLLIHVLTPVQLNKIT